MATGCLALLLEFIKWIQSGVRLEISSNPNMVPLDPTPGFPSERHIVAWVRNTGDKPTTLTNIAFEHYPSNLWRILCRRGKTYAIFKPVPNPLPQILGPGEQWSTIVRPGPEIEEARRRGILVCSVWHSMARKPVRQTVRFA
jgi:hypothetical protein